MNTDQKNIDKFFHRDLAGASEQPPVHIWDNIESALEKDERDAAVLFRRKRFLYPAAAMLLLIAGAGILLRISGRNAGVHQPTVNTSASAGAEQPKITAGANQHSDIPGAGETTTPGLPETSAVKASGRTLPAIVSDHVVPARLTEVADAGDIPGTDGIISPAYAANAPAGYETGRSRVIPAPETIDGVTTQPRIAGAPVWLPFSVSAAVKDDAAPVTVKRRSRWSVVAFFAPDITTRNLEQNFYSTLDEKKEEIVRTEKNGKMDFTLGARLEYRISPHWSVQSGLSFSTNTIDIASKMMFGRFDKDGTLKFRFNLSTGYAFMKGKSLPAPRFVGDSALALSSSSVLHYVNVPLSLKYNFTKGRFNFSAQAGVVARFITRQSIDAVYANNSGARERAIANEIQGLKRTYMNGLVGLGVDYSLNRRVALTVFPSFNFATSSINRDAPVKAYPNTLSLAAGIRLNL